MKDKKDIEQGVENDSFFEKIKEETTPAQVSQAIIAKILLKLNKQKE